MGDFNSQGDLEIGNLGNGYPLCVRHTGKLYIYLLI